MPIHNDLLIQIKNNDPSLTTVHISSTCPPLTAQDMQQLVDALVQNHNTYVKTLLLYDNEIGDAGVEILSTLKTIESLSLDGNNLTDKGAQSLAKMTTLKSLQVACNEIGDAGLEQLFKLPNLQTLIIHDNPFTTSGLKKIIIESNKNFVELLTGVDELDEHFNPAFVKPLPHPQILSTSYVNEFLASASSFYGDYSGPENKETKVNNSIHDIKISIEEKLQKLSLI